MADPDLTKLQSTTLNPAFKNNDEYTGSFNLTGTMSAGSKIITKTITLPDNVEIADILFKGRANGGFGIPTGDPRPNDAWFKRGAVWARTDDSPSYVNYPMPFDISASISGDQLTITASAFKTFTANLTITSETVYYKVIDYSVF
ncbi:hypothetical protein KDA23_05675 [Candidatus Saccharibacteria bacterium]|nr:hypothetical protein [Candidatus Saccharibacteria bacterium]